jgi:hypothetical protein
MRVLQIAPPWFPVPPTGYGGIEWVVSSLADGLTALGHDVTLVANGDSETSAELVSVFDGSTPQRLGDVWMDAAHAVTAYLHANDVDVVHDHTGVIGPAIAAAGGLRTPVVNTLHGPWTDGNTLLYRAISRRVALTSISHDQAARAPEGVRVAAVVHNGIELDAYPVGRQREDFLLFVGRASPEKGPEVAIEVARRVGLPLVMAMKVNEPDEHRYLAEVVQPAMERADVHVELRTDVGHEREGGPHDAGAGRARPDRLGRAVRTRDGRVRRLRGAGDRVPSRCRARARARRHLGPARPTRRRRRDDRRGRGHRPHRPARLPRVGGGALLLATHGPPLPPRLRGAHARTASRRVPIGIAPPCRHVRDERASQRPWERSPRRSA